MAGNGYEALVDPAEAGVDESFKGAKGQSFLERIKTGFPSSPFYDGSITRDTITAVFKGVLDGTQTDNTDFSGMSMDYADAPDIGVDADGSSTDVTVAEQTTAFEGLPASPFGPNLASPGGTVGTLNVNYTSLTAVTPSDISIVSTTENPSATSLNIGAQDFTTIEKGKSS